MRRISISSDRVRYTSCAWGGHAQRTPKSRDAVTPCKDVSGRLFSRKTSLVVLAGVEEMPNERLRSSFAMANLSVLDVASHIGVDPKTVERWITKARVPHRAHRWAAAKLLGTDE